MTGKFVVENIRINGNKPLGFRIHNCTIIHEVQLSQLSLLDSGISISDVSTEALTLSDVTVDQRLTTQTIISGLKIGGSLRLQRSMLGRRLSLIASEIGTNLDIEEVNIAAPLENEDLPRMLLWDLRIGRNAIITNCQFANASLFINEVNSTGFFELNNTNITCFTSPVVWIETSEFRGGMRILGGQFIGKSLKIEKSDIAGDLSFVGSHFSPYGLDAIYLRRCQNSGNVRLRNVLMLKDYILQIAAERDRVEFIYEDGPDNGDFLKVDVGPDSSPEEHELGLNANGSGFLRWQNVKVERNFFIANSSIRGALRIAGSSIGGRTVFQKVVIDNLDPYSLLATRTKFIGQIQFPQDNHFANGIRISHSELVNGFWIKKGEYWGSPEALRFNSVNIGLGVILEPRALLYGNILLNKVNSTGRITISCDVCLSDDVAEWYTRSAPEIQLIGCDVHRLLWSPSGIPMSLYLISSSIAVLEIPKPVGSFSSNGLRLNSSAGILTRNVKEVIEWVSNSGSASRQIRTFDDLAVYYRDIGRLDFSNMALYEKELTVTRTLSLPKRIPRRLFQYIAGYGLRPGRSAIGLALLVLVNLYYFLHSGFCSVNSQSASSSSGPELITKTIEEHMLNFLSSFSKTVDLLSPVTLLEPATCSNPSEIGPVVIVFLQLSAFGSWFFFAILLAGVTGLLRKGY